MKINPYLNFNGTCEEAFNFYKSIFGGEFTIVSRFESMPDDEKKTIDQSNLEKIMHISLPIDKSNTLMGSDTLKDLKFFDYSSNVSVSITFDNNSKAEQIFKNLSEEGTIHMPYGKTFWGADFGSVIDKFNIKWLVSCYIK